MRFLSDVQNSSVKDIVDGAMGVEVLSLRGARDPDGTCMRESRRIPGVKLTISVARTARKSRVAVGVTDEPRMLRMSVGQEMFSHAADAPSLRMAAMPKMKDCGTELPNEDAPVFLISQVRFVSSRGASRFEAAKEG